MSPTRSYLIVREPMVVEAANPFEAAKLAREEEPKLEGQSVTVVAQSLSRDVDGRRWIK